MNTNVVHVNFFRIFGWELWPVEGKQTNKHTNKQTDWRRNGQNDSDDQYTWEKSEIFSSNNIALEMTLAAGAV